MVSRGTVMETRHFVVEPCHGCPLPGYLIVRPRVPMRSLSHLPADEAAEFGPLLKKVVGAIESVVRPIRIYVAQFGEETGDLHFHVFPRTELLTEEYLREFPEQKDLIHGPLLLDWARQRYRSGVRSETAVADVEELRELLNGDGEAT